MALGDQIAAWAEQNKELLGINNILWRVRDHFDHVHIDFKEAVADAFDVQAEGRARVGTEGTEGQQGRSAARHRLQERSGQAGREEQAAAEAEQLGHGLVKGIFEELGFPDVFGKPPTEWGIWKLAMGGLGYGKGLTRSGGRRSGGSAAPGGGGDPFSILDSLFQQLDHSARDHRWCAPRPRRNPECDGPE